MVEVCVVDGVEWHLLPSADHTTEKLVDYAIKLDKNACICSVESVCNFLTMDTPVGALIANYLKLYGNINKPNSWDASVAKLLHAGAWLRVQKMTWSKPSATPSSLLLAATTSHSLALSAVTKVAVTSKFLLPQVRKPTGEYDPDATLEECVAYQYSGAVTRGFGEVIREGTLMTPEGFASVLKTVTGPQWKACEIPSGSRMCAMVVVPCGSAGIVSTRLAGATSTFAGQIRKYQLGDNLIKAQAFVFHKYTGALIVKLPLRVPTSQQLHSVFEVACTKQAPWSIKVCDCSFLNGTSIKSASLSSRLLQAANAITNWFFVLPVFTDCLAEKKQVETKGEQISAPKIIVQPYGPPMTLVNGAKASAVLFVNDAAPYELHAGGNAFLWKQPTLDPALHEAVLTCRGGVAMATDEYKSCLLVSVGPCDVPADLCDTSSETYVCRPTDAGGWIHTRRAKRHERIFTYDEASSCMAGELVTTQITRVGVQRLLRGIELGVPPAIRLGQKSDRSSAGQEVASTGVRLGARTVNEKKWQVVRQTQKQ